MDGGLHQHSAEEHHDEANAMDESSGEAGALRGLPALRMAWMWSQGDDGDHDGH